MTATRPPEPAVRLLPAQVRPIAGEGQYAFIARLAAANHIKSTYLAHWLREPPLRRGMPSWERLAAATGRSPQTLRRVLATKRCGHCRELFVHDKRNGRPGQWCSHRCRSAASHAQTRQQRAEAVCGHCGIPIPTATGRPRKWCSPHCQRAARRSAAPAPEPAYCRHCGSLIPASTTDRRRRVWCSSGCRRDAQRAKTPRPDPAYCRHCGVLLPAPVVKRRPRQWCSSRCLYAAWRTRRLAAEASRNPSPDTGTSS